VSVAIVNEFIGKCSTIRVPLAFLVTTTGFTKPARERVARSWSQAMEPDLAWIDKNDINSWLEDETSSEAFLKSIVRRAGYGRD
jgi:hypothetical protein